MASRPAARRTLDANLTTMLPRSHPSPISRTAGGPTFRKVQKQTDGARRQSGPGCVKERRRRCLGRSDAQKSTPARVGALTFCFLPKLVSVLLRKEWLATFRYANICFDLLLKNGFESKKSAFLITKSCQRLYPYWILF
jgi:hypothetical protein